MLKEVLILMIEFLIIKVTNEYQGYLTKEAWEWIRKHVTS